jgi:hypothetical protein
MVAIAALLRIRYGFASPKNRPKTEKENALFWLHFLISWFPDSFVVGLAPRLKSTLLAP